MALAATFLGGAKGRLLAPLVPFRFFGTALLFQVLAWGVLLAAADEVSHFQGGLGWPLAALHLVTLGVLVMTAVGASLQLLPVATRQAVSARRWPYAALWAGLTLGVGVLTLGMGLAWPSLLMVGAMLTSAALLGYLVLLARNLHGAKGMALVVTHGWAAVLSLLVLLGAAWSLVGVYQGTAVLVRSSAMGLHVSFATYGFMGLLVMGFSYILVPMFALSDNPSPHWAWLSLLLALLALVVAAMASIAWLGVHAWAAAAALGLGALMVHVGLMLRALRSGMRQGLGKPFVLVRLGWAALIASLLVALMRAFDLLPQWGSTVFGVLLVGGLLTVLMGVLSRIVPFLASMHAGAGQRRAPTPSSLTAQRPLNIHFYCHVGAMLLLLVACVQGSAWMLRLAAALGLAGACAFGSFFVIAWRRMRQNAPASERVAPAQTSSLRQIN